MKYFKNIYFYIFFTIISVTVIYALTEVGFSREEIKQQKEIYKARCEEILKSEETDSETLIDKEYCLLEQKYDSYTIDAYTQFSQILYDRTLNFFLPWVFPVLIILIFIIPICKLFKSKNIKAMLLRMEYKDFLKKLFTFSYLNAFIVPLMLFIIWIVTYYYTGHLNYQVMPNYARMTEAVLVGMPFNWISYYLNIILFYTLLISLGLIVLSDVKNPILATIETIIALFLLLFASEAIGTQIVEFFGMDPLSSNLINAHVLGGVEKVWDLTIVFAIYNVLAGIRVYFGYRSKERLIQMCEK